MPCPTVDRGVVCTPTEDIIPQILISGRPEQGQVGRGTNADLEEYREVHLVQSGGLQGREGLGGIQLGHSNEENVNNQAESSDQIHQNVEPRV